MQVGQSYRAYCRTPLVPSWLGRGTSFLGRMLPEWCGVTALALSLRDEVDRGAAAMDLGAKRTIDDAGFAVGGGNQLASYVPFMGSSFDPVCFQADSGAVLCRWDIPRSAMEAAGLRL